MARWVLTCVSSAVLVLSCPDIWAAKDGRVRAVPVSARLSERNMESERVRLRPGGVSFHRIIDFYNVTSGQIEANFFAPAFTGPFGNGIGVVAREESDGKSWLVLKGFGNKNLIRLLGSKSIGVDAEAHDTVEGIDANFDGWIFDAEIDLRISTRWENGIPITRFDELAMFEGLPPDRIQNLPVNAIPEFGIWVKQIFAGVAARAHERYAQFDKTFASRLNHLLFGDPYQLDWDGDGLPDQETMAGTLLTMVPFVFDSMTAATQEVARKAVGAVTGVEAIGNLASSGLGLGAAMTRAGFAFGTLPLKICAAVVFGTSERPTKAK